MLAPRLFLSATAVATFALTTWLAAQQARQVDDAALKDAGRSGDEWISYNGGWAEQRYSPLTQINSGNVGKLGLAWSMEVPTAAGGRDSTRHEGTPLFFDGKLYSIGPWSIVYAVDASTGKELWHQDPGVNQDIWRSRICCGVVNRGIAIYEGKIIAPVVDGRLRAYDAATGSVVWETRVSPENIAYTITMAPRVIKGGRVIIGVSGGEYAIRGFFDAYDAKTGKQAWRFWTVPGDPSKPLEQPIYGEWAKTWTGEYWKFGGGAPVWNGMAYDEPSDTLYVGTGQPSSWSDYHRGKGDALCSNCILAVRGATGKYVWHYQTTPGDNWDFDSIADIMLADLPINGKKRQVLMHAPKNGFFYVLDRKTGELLSAEPWVTVNWSSGVNLKTGRPTINPEANYTTDDVNIMPGPGGGHVWPPMSFNPNTGLVYLPGTIGTGYTFQANPEFMMGSMDIGPTGRGVFNMGTGKAKGAAKGGPPPGIDAGKNAPPPPGIDVAAAGPGASKGLPAGPGAGKGAAKGPPPPSPPSIGPTGRGNILSAWDPVTNTEKWRGLGAGFNQGGTLAMGDVVLSSVNTRLLAYNAVSGEQLLDLQTGLSQAGPPMTFMLGGKQYVIVVGGPAQQGGGGGAGAAKGGGGGPGGAKGAPAAPPAPSHMLALVVGGTPLPGVTPPSQ